MVSEQLRCQKLQTISPNDEFRTFCVRFGTRWQLMWHNRDTCTQTHTHAVVQPTELSRVNQKAAVNCCVYLSLVKWACDRYKLASDDNVIICQAVNIGRKRERESGCVNGECWLSVNVGNFRGVRSLDGKNHKSQLANKNYLTQPTPITAVKFGWFWPKNTRSLSLALRHRNTHRNVYGCFW